jgi:hypothetical protein
MRIDPSQAAMADSIDPMKHPQVYRKPLQA